MTVITKNLSDKKSDNLEEPLVDNIVVEHNDEGKKCDLESGSYPMASSQATRYIISARVRPYYSLIFILMLVLLVTTSLLGIFGTEYLYEQYRYLVGSEQKPEVFRAWGTLSFEDDPTAMAYETKVPARFEKTEEPLESDSIVSILFQQTSLGNNENEPGSQESKEEFQERKNELKEEFELDLNEDRFEKINVPNNGASRFIHDFYSNYTAIVDEKSERCFIMPLDRSVILPPKSLYDLLFKMKDGYYSIDTERVRKDMQVVMPAITNLEQYGVYISRECQGFTSYKLEKFISGVVKRSTTDTGIATFTLFTGSDLVEFSINNLPLENEPAPYAIP